MTVPCQIHQFFPHTWLWQNQAKQRQDHWAHQGKEQGFWISATIREFLRRREHRSGLLIMVQLPTPMETVKLLRRDVTVQIAFIIVRRCWIWSVWIAEVIKRVQGQKLTMFISCLVLYIVQIFRVQTHEELSVCPLCFFLEEKFLPSIVVEFAPLDRFPTDNLLQTLWIVLKNLGLKFPSYPVIYYFVHLKSNQCRVVFATILEASW